MTSASSAAVPPTGAGAAGRPLNVIAYNVQFLPGLGRLLNERKHPEYRARTIGQKLAGYDIVGLNETFDDGPRKLLLDQLRRAWGKDFNMIISPKPSDGRVSGGCAIVSRLPFLETHSAIYTKSSSLEQYGIWADGHAAKGPLHARIWRGGTAPKDDFVDVFVTHLESKDRAARNVQYQELARFVRTHSDPRRPVLIMGDMNTRGNPASRRDPDSQYHDMMSSLRRGRPGTTVVDLWLELNTGVGGTSSQETPDGGRRIDYILLSNPGGGTNRLRPLAMRVNRFLDPRVIALSDHSAVEADLLWQRR